MYIHDLTPGEHQDIVDEVKAIGASTKPEGIVQITHNSRDLRRFRAFLDSISFDKNIKDLVSEFTKFRQINPKTLPANLRRAQTFAKLQEDFPEVPMEILIEFVYKIESAMSKSKGAAEES